MDIKSRKYLKYKIKRSKETGTIKKTKAKLNNVYLIDHGWIAMQKCVKKKKVYLLRTSIFKLLSELVYIALQLQVLKFSFLKNKIK